MNERRTMSMLQRVPVILAVTAASYGLPLQAQAGSQRAAAKQAVARTAAPAGQCLPASGGAAQR